MSEERCYFGCDEPIYHTLLELPQSDAPGLCRFHSASWGAYRRAGAERKFTWPDDFWPWVDHVRSEMDKGTEIKHSSAESRASGTEITAEETITGAWYTVPSGEIERCYGSRPRGRGIQVGFVRLWDSGTDGDEIRWLQGRTSVLVADELDAVKQMRAFREQNAEGRLPDLAWGLCPRNGTVCSLCGLPQRETPSGTMCEGEHKNAQGVWKLVEAPSEQHTNLGRVEELGRVEMRSAVPISRTDELEATIVLPEASDVGFMGLGASKESAYEDPDLQAGGPAMTDEQIANEFPEAVEEAKTQIKKAGPTTVFHKSLHIDHRTPKELFDAEVRRWGPFYLDCAATEENKLCEHALTPEIDALGVDWAGTEEIYEEYGRNRFLNHPYSPGEAACPENRDLCTKKKCVQRGYHIDKPIASSGDWITYARDQTLKDGVPTDVLTKAAIETNWWRDAIRVQPKEAGLYLKGEVDPFGGPAAEYLNTTSYKAATWYRFTWENLVIEVTDIEGRVEFEREGNTGGAGFPSALVMFYRPGYVFK